MEAVAFVSVHVGVLVCGCRRSLFGGFFGFEFLVTYLIKIVAEGKKEVQKKNNPILFSHIFVCIYFRAQGSGKMFSLGGSMNHDLHQFTFLRRS